jgi:hypothetical protein
MNNVTDSRFERVVLGISVLVLSAGIFLSVSLLQRVGSFGSHSETSIVDRLLFDVGESAEASVLKNTQDPYESSYDGTSRKTGDGPLILTPTDRSGPAVPDGHQTGRSEPKLGTVPDLPRNLSPDNPGLNRPTQANMRDHRTASTSAKGGISDVANFRDSANLVVRDGSGRLKRHQTER